MPIFTKSRSKKLIRVITEMRSRIIKVCVVFISLFLLCYNKHDEIYSFITAPILDFFKNDKEVFIYTGLWESFFAKINLSLYSALFLTTPFITLQIYLFCAEGLYQKEKRVFVLFAILSHFVAAVSFLIMYFIIFPNAISFLMTNKVASFKLVVSSYINSFVQMTVAFAFAFQLPLVMIGLIKVNIIDRAFFIKNFRSAIVIIFIIATIITPPDIISQLVCAAFLIFMYCIVLLLTK
jgi:sec-independent protein translocase protein TatC